MPIDTHFPSILLSNWQSSVAKTARKPITASDGFVRPAVDFDDANIKAAAAAAQADHNGETDPPAGIDAGLWASAKGALDWAKSLVTGTEAEIEQAKAAFAQDGKLDPFWLECILEFVEHYTLTKHSEVPYKKYVNISDYVLPQSWLPENATIAIIGDWGTGTERAQKLLAKIAEASPDIVIHLGDIYYACTSSEANSFYENSTKAFAGKKPRLFTLCGNHDMYSGAAPYYSLLARLNQPASFFCLRNKYWQILAGDTGYNDFDPLTQGVNATWIRDFDEGDGYSELAWHRDKLVNAGQRKTIMLTHHQLFTRNSSIAHRDPTPSQKPVNDYLLKQFGDFIPEISLWLWGHEHNQLIYKEFKGLLRGRCVGASAIPVTADTSLTKINDALEGIPDDQVPALIDRANSTLRPEASGGLYQLGYALLRFHGAGLTAQYLQFDTGTNVSEEMFSETL